MRFYHLRRVIPEPVFFGMLSPAAYFARSVRCRSCQEPSDQTAVLHDFLQKYYTTRPDGGVSPITGIFLQTEAGPFIIAGMNI
jgi:hypothetical protein